MSPLPVTLVLTARSIFFRRCLLSILLVSGIGAARIASSATPNLNTFVMDGLSGAPIANQRVDAYQIQTDGRKSWRARGQTDTAGKVSLLLPSPESGAPHVLRVKRFEGSHYSPVVTQPGELTFPVGTLQVAAINGRDDSPYVGRLNLRRVGSDGQIHWAGWRNTDAQGRARFTPEGLGSGVVYRVQGRSAIDQRWKLSQAIEQPGEVTVRVGNAPLRVTLVDALDGTPLPDIKITVRERLADGSAKWRTSGRSDAQGRSDFDLDGLGNGRVYQLQTRAYDGQHSYSPEITQPGDFRFAVGALRVTVVSGADGKPMTDTRVSLGEIQADGKRKHLKSARTNAQGVVHFDTLRLDGKRELVLWAKSAVDGRTRISPRFKSGGAVTFQVGNAVLQVHLRDALSKAAIVDTRVDAFELLSDGKRKWRAKATTDAQGNARFDLAGLSSGARYQLRARVFNRLNAFSEVLGKTGDFTFPVGKLSLRVLSGADGSPLVDTKITLRQRTAEDKSEWISSGKTDANGMIRFDPTGLGQEGVRFFAQARSPADHSRKISQDFTEAGRFDFTVGNKPLVVRVVNGVTGATVADLRVTVRERLEDGNSVWRAAHDTDADGQVVFDLDGLGEGRHYFLRAKPYNGGATYSPELTAPGEFRFAVGTVPVTLVDADQGKVLPGKKLVLLEKLVDGKLKWRRSGTTDETGTVHFDPTGLDQGRLYVARVRDPFGNGKKLFSPLIDAPGPVKFAISPDDDSGLDQQPPEVVINSPASGDKAAVTGFTVTGAAKDDKTLDSVVLTISDPLLGDQTLPVDVDPDNGAWSVEVAAGLVSEEQTVTLTAHARDRAQNVTEISIQVQIVADNQAPVITLSSHAEGDSVPDSGFLLSGNVDDVSGIASFTASLSDANLGQTIAARALEIAPDSGAFTLVVQRGEISANGTATVTLEASDTLGNPASQSITLEVVPSDTLLRQLVNRTSFGASPELLDSAEALGPDDFLVRQLNPAGIDDSAFQALLAGFAPQTDGDLRTWQLLHAAYSRRQLLEVMTWFWENHFNTDVRKTDSVADELAENRAFRSHALGNFRDLLQDSATSPAMIIYLDGDANVKASPNENYPRELLELHSLGVDGGYTQGDVEEVARAFTGWTVSGGGFFFDASQHDEDAKQVLGVAIPAGGGQSDGEAVLDIIAIHPSTAHFICFKLSQVFVDDQPPESLVGRCADTFQANANAPDQIAQVLRTLMSSPEFSDPGHFRSKIKTPLEMTAGLVRNLVASGGLASLGGDARRMGMDLFHFPVPTGFSETGDDWISSSLMLERIRFVNRVVQNGASDVDLDLPGLLRERGFETAEGIAGFLFELTLGSDFTPLEWNQALGILNDDGNTPFDLNAADADQRLRRMLGTLTSYPEYQFQ